ncbi:MAG TPA: hybrid sensor histidine kinase/response regulator [Elusimicrobia bacterium]|nr:hybrid sensor histidine kinase/response regulator [Elusimicrobiota bacterium]
MEDIGEKLMQDRINELRKNTDFTSAIFDHLIGYAIIAADFDGNILAYNQGAHVIYGYSPREVIGSQNIEIFFPRQFIDSGRLEEIIADLMGTGRASYEGEKIRRDGSSFPAKILFTLTKNKEGQAVGFVEIAEDLTERKRAEMKIRELNADLERRVAARTVELESARNAAVGASNAKSVFLANMSHEIRTPLNAILGMAEILSDTALDGEQSKYVRILKKAGGTLLTLINDVLDLSKIESGHLETELTDFDLESVVEGTAEIMGLRAQEKKIELTVHIRKDVPTALRGDANRLRQILINLMGNAIKFTASGEVRLSVDRDPGNKENLLFKIADTGIGIPPDRIESLFHDFVQADSSITRRYGGTGLGLSISKSLVEALGGRIWVESELGVGSVFYFTMPMGINPDIASPEPEKKKYGHLRVLIADLSASHRNILTELLGRVDAQSTQAADVETAAREIKTAADEGHPYNLLLLDSRMLESQKNEELLSPFIRKGLCVVTILPPHHRSGDLGRSNILPISGRLIKPIKRAKLLELLALLEDDRGNAAAAASRPAGQSGEGPPEQDHRVLRLLLVDDSADNQAVILAYLQNTGHSLDIAENGEAAVEKCKAVAYDLVLMDLQMPVMDGLTATRIIRSWESENGRAPTPIVALTAHALKGEIEKSLGAGCNAHITKPIYKDVLLKTIRRHARAPADAGKIHADVDPALRRLLPRFLQNREEDVAAIEDALQKRDYALIHDIGHRVKGIGGFDFMPLYKMGTSLEKGADAKSPAIIRECVEDMKHFLSRIELP